VTSRPTTELSDPAHEDSRFETAARWPGSLQRLVLRPVESSKTSIKEGQNTLRFVLKYLTVLLLCG